MPFDGSKLKTQSNNNHFAIVVFPWQFEWPDSPICTGDEVFNEYYPEVISSGMVSRVIHISHQKRKELMSGSLTIDMLARLPQTGVYTRTGKPDLPVESRISALGNWVIFLTSSNGEIGNDYDSAMKSYIEGKAIVQFIGQISSVHSSYFADASGALRQTNKITCKDWSFVFDAPPQLHHWNFSANIASSSSNAIGESALKKEIEDLRKAVDKAKSTLAPATNVLSFNSFIRPYLTLIMMGMYDKEFWKDVTVNENIEKIGADLGPFNRLICRLPALPKNLLSFLEGEDAEKTANEKAESTDIVSFSEGKGSASKTFSSNWYKRFMGFLSGVQKWNVDNAPKRLPSGLLEIKEDQRKDIKHWHPNTAWSQKWLDTDAGRPKFPMKPSFITAGISARQQIEESVEDLGIAEAYTEIIQTVDDTGKHRAIPVLVTRDLPFSMKRYEVKNNVVDLKKDNNTDNKVKWTYYEDLPFTFIKTESIITLDHVSEILGTSNYLLTSPQSQIYAGAVNVTWEIAHGISVNAENQFRFGTMRRVLTGNLGFNVDSKGGKISPTNELDGWPKSLREKFSEIYSTSYRYGSGTLKIKDDNYRLSVGHNVQFRLRDDDGWTYCGHVRGIDRRLTVGEGGAVQTMILIHLTRICVRVDSEKDINVPWLAPFPQMYLKTEMFNKKDIPDYPDLAASRPAAVPVVTAPQPEQTPEDINPMITKAEAIQAAAPKLTLPGSDTIKSQQCSPSNLGNVADTEFDSNTSTKGWFELTDDQRKTLSGTEIGNLPQSEWYKNVKKQAWNIMAGIDQYFNDYTYRKKAVPSLKKAGANVLSSKLQPSDKRLTEELKAWQGWYLDILDGKIDGKRASSIYTKDNEEAFFSAYPEVIIRELKKDYNAKNPQSNAVPSEELKKMRERAKKEAQRVWDQLTGQFDNGRIGFGTWSLLSITCDKSDKAASSEKKTGDQ